MKPPFIQPGSRSSVGIILAFLCVLFCAGRSAEARCGGVVVMTAAGGSSLERLEILAHDDDRHAAEFDPSLPTDAAPRCSGASCSQNNLPPPLPGRGFEIAPARGDGLSTSGPPHPPAADSRPFRVVDDPFDLPRPPSGVFHPPRPAS